MFPSLFSSRFINARRRIVQPMIDQSNRAGKSEDESADRAFLFLSCMKKTSQFLIIISPAECVWSPFKKEHSSLPVVYLPPLIIARVVPAPLTAILAFKLVFMSFCVYYTLS